MNTKPLALFAALALFSAQAEAHFIFFHIASHLHINGHAKTSTHTTTTTTYTTSGDGAPVVKLENCVRATAQIGDKVTMVSGSVGTVTELGDTSSRCKNPSLPRLAHLSHDYLKNSQAGLDVPEGYQEKELTDTDEFSGFLINATDPEKKVGLAVNSRQLKPGSDLKSHAKIIADSMKTRLDDVSISNEEELTINGLRALRFEVRGKNKSFLGKYYTYMLTLLEARDEIIVLNSYALDDVYAQEKEEFKGLVYKVKGLEPPMIAQETVSDADDSGAPPLAQPPGISEPH